MSVVTDCQIIGYGQHYLHSVSVTAIRKCPYVNNYMLKKNNAISIFFKGKIIYAKKVIFNSLK